MRRKIVAGNWKMNLLPLEGQDLVEQILQKERPNEITTIICPPYIHLAELSRIIKDEENIFIGAQDCSAYESGAYTGQISAPMLKAVGCSYVILGHSERRNYQGENDELVREKIKKALAIDLEVIYCCGETQQIRTAGNYVEYVLDQIQTAIFEMDPQQMKHITVAYEPVWAIGTGKVASPDQAQEMHAHIRDAITKHYGHDIGQNISILYGGSCKPSNAEEIFSKTDVDGGLIGGAALKAEDFVALHHAF